MTGDERLREDVQNALDTRVHQSQHDGFGWIRAPLLVLYASILLSTALGFFFRGAWLQWVQVAIMWATIFYLFYPGFSLLHKRDSKSGRFNPYIFLFLFIAGLCIWTTWQALSPNNYTSEFAEHTKYFWMLLFTALLVFNSTLFLGGHLSDLSLESVGGGRFDSETVKGLTHLQLRHALSNGLDESTAAGPDADPNIVRIYYGTNRAMSSVGSKYYSGRRGELSYGECLVRIPDKHLTGKLEGPSWRSLEFKETPEKHIVILSEKKLDRSLWKAALRADSGATTTKQAFVFIHGFNVSFKDAARQTAQIAYDLQFKGIPAFYSWPARGGIRPYPFDEAAVEAAEPLLEAFLLDLLDSSEADAIYVIAHSMGNRAVTKTLSEISRKSPALAQKIRHVVLAAPDIDADTFKYSLGPKLVQAGLSATMYASANDKAMFASKRYHGYQRAGDAKPAVVVVQGIITIDASAIDAPFMRLNHSYYAQADPVISDISYLIKGVPAASRHRLVLRAAASGDYYFFKP